MTVKSVQDRLREAAALFEERNAVYGSNYETFGPAMEAVLPGATTIDGSAQWGRVMLFAHLVTKITRYAQNMRRDRGHADSLADLCVYAQMLAQWDDLCAAEAEVGAAHEPAAHEPAARSEVEKSVSIPWRDYAYRDTHTRLTVPTEAVVPPSPVSARRHVGEIPRHWKNFDAHYDAVAAENGIHRYAVELAWKTYLYASTDRRDDPSLEMIVPVVAHAMQTRLNATQSPSLPHHLGPVPSTWTPPFPRDYYSEVSKETGINRHTVKMAWLIYLYGADTYNRDVEAEASIPAVVDAMMKKVKRTGGDGPAGDDAYPDTALLPDRDVEEPKFLEDRCEWRGTGPARTTVVKSHLRDSVTGRATPMKRDPGGVSTDDVLF